MLIVPACGGDDTDDAASEVATETSSDTRSSTALPDEDEGASTSTAGGQLESDTTSTSIESDSTGTGQDICGELQRIKDLESEVTLAINELLVGLLEPGDDVDEQLLLGDLQTVADMLDDNLEQVLDAYDRAVALATPDVADDLERVAATAAAITPRIADAYRGVESLDQLAPRIEQALADPDLLEETQEGAVASVRLNEFTIPTCGFQLSN